MKRVATSPNSIMVRSAHTAGRLHTGLCSSSEVCAHAGMANTLMCLQGRALAGTEDARERLPGTSRGAGHVPEASANSQHSTCQHY